MKIFKGAYGIDILSMILILLSSILTLFRFTYIIGLLVLLIAIYRMFSKNTYKRQEENSFCISKLNILLSRFGKSIPYNTKPISFDNFSFLAEKISYSIKQSKNYKITKCPNCKQKLRLPRKKGKILVTCKRCGHKFDLKT